MFDDGADPSRQRPRITERHKDACLSIADEFRKSAYLGDNDGPRLSPGLNDRDALGLKHTWKDKDGAGNKEGLLLVLRNGTEKTDSLNDAQLLRSRLQSS